jgi:putative endonuclease
MALTIGQDAENVVANYLIGQGYKLLAKNVRYGFGELDLVLLDKDILFFCEVKYRKNLSYGEPWEAVDSKKQKKITMAANAYLTSNYKIIPWCRFDVVSLSGDLNNPVIDHIKDAFFDEY